MIMPSHSTVLVIGGGPAGAYAASALAREGIQVTVIEAAKFPRYHIGESMLPSINSFMQFIGAEGKLREHGFCAKPGAAVKFNQHKQEGYTDFISKNPKNGAYNVIRSEFDELLLRHSEECGADVFELTKVTEICFERTKHTCDLRPTSASYIRDNGDIGTISFDYLVDASGRNGIMSTKYLKNRKMNKSLHNIACWAYWTGHKMYMPGTRRHNAPFFEALTDESGWGWFIPLNNGSVSVGIVMDLDISTAKKAAGRKATSDGEYSLKDHYLDQLRFVPSLKKFLDGAGLKNEGVDTVKSASDFSYSADRYAGDHYRLAGDASAFIDPFFSSGVHLALLGGLSAATTICASINGQCSESEAAQFHDIKVSTAYTRFLLVVLSAYKQIRSQKLDVLADVDETNFNRAFDIFRPVIQGTADVGKQLTEDELQRTMDFCSNIFAPTDPEMHEAVIARLNHSQLLSPSAPILSNEDIEQVLANDDEDARLVVSRINARKPLNEMYKGPDGLQTNSVNGYTAHLLHGSLGLVRVQA